MYLRVVCVFAFYANGYKTRVCFVAYGYIDDAVFMGHFIYIVFT